MLTIQKIVSIKGIGRFKNYSAHGPSIDFAKLALIYGANGTGKSTLVSLFRSMQTGDRKYINMRQRLSDETLPPPSAKVNLLLSGTTVIVEYGNGRGWTQAPSSDIRIFDTNFIHEHVHSGESVFKEQRSNLFSLLFSTDETNEIISQFKELEGEIRDLVKEEQKILDSIENSVAKTLKLNAQAESYIGRDLFFQNLGNEEFVATLKAFGVYKAAQRSRGLNIKRLSKIALLSNLKTEMITKTDAVISVHQKTVNEYLSRLGVGFQIVDVSPSNFSEGKWPRIKYAISINNVNQKIFETNTAAPGTPSFGTILSEADKRTLSFAFFMSMLDKDPNLDQRVVIFDDPMSSYDRSRREATATVLTSLSQRVSQMFVLSHDDDFLGYLAKRKRVTLSSQEVYKISSGESSLKYWDIDSALRHDSTEQYILLIKYYENHVGDEKSVAQAIRTLLEEHFRFRFPLDFGMKDWLGDFIEKVRDSHGNGRLSKIHAKLADLSEICNYASPFHHATPPKIDPGELHTYIKRTLDLLHS